MIQSKRQAFIDFCKVFFNEPGIDEKGFDDVKVEDGETHTVTFTFTVTRQFIRELAPEVSKLLQDFKDAQAYSSTGEVGEAKLSMSPRLDRGKQ